MQPFNTDTLSKDHRDTLRKLFLAIRFSRKFSAHRARLIIRQFLDSGCATELLQPLVEGIDRDSFLAAECELERAERLGVSVSSVFDDDYPENLRAIPDPPVVLFVRGVMVQRASVAIVGMRRASRYGLQIAEKYAHALSERNILVVSGLAYGIDAAAHRGAIIGARGDASARHPGVAVLGSGVLNVTPAAHRALAEELIACGGALVSEYGLDEPAAKHHFPERNRLISGISDAVVVVEAEERSGSLITARCAAEQGRDVLAVPGPLGASSSSGTNRLLRDGATMLLELADLIDTLPRQKLERQPAEGATQPSGATSGVSNPTPKADASAKPPTPDEDTVLSELSPTRLDDFDSLMEKTGFSTPKLLAILGSLELGGHITCHDGGLYIRNQTVDMRL